MPNSEVLSAVLLPGNAIDDPKSPASAILKDVGGMVLEQEGCQRYYSGVELESPEQFHMIVDWDEIGSHQKFMTKDYYQPFADRFLSITTGRSQFLLFHVDFEPESAMSKVLSAPVTEITTLYFGSGELPVGYEEQAKKFLDMLDNGPDGYHGYTAGRSYEDIETESGKSKVFVLLVGWESVEAEVRFGNSSAFKANVQHLKQSATKVETRNVQFRKGTSS